MSQKRKSAQVQQQCTYFIARRTKTNAMSSIKGQFSSHEQSNVMRTRLRGFSNLAACYGSIAQESIELLRLPNELLGLVMRNFNAKELMSLRCVCRKLRNEIDCNNSLWLRASYGDMWPTTDEASKQIFERGFKANNKECLIKMALSHLYYFNLNPRTGKDTSNMNHNAKLSAKYLLLFDACLYPKKPLTWMLIRPPWSSMKKDIHSYLVKSDHQQNDSLNYTMKRIEHFGNATCLSFSPTEKKVFCHSTFFTLLQHKPNIIDKGSKLQWLRRLQECISMGNIDAHFELARYIFSTSPSEILISLLKAEEFSKSLFQRSVNYRSNLEQQKTRREKEMRTIIIDWLAEVCASKEIEPQMLHAAVHYMDLFLLSRPCERTQLQLLGITCLLIAVKALSVSGLHRLTIRECSLLTDETYTYQEVVRMMGEIIAMLKGDVFQPTAWNYLDVLLSFSGKDVYVHHMAHYLLELSLEYTCFGNYSPALLACAVLLLVFVILKETYLMIWPPFLSTFTGYQGHELVDVASLLHYKCFLTAPYRDDRDQPLSGVRDKYSLDVNMRVAQTVPIPSTCELKDRIMAYDDMLSCISEEPLKFVRNMPLDDTLNASTGSTKSDDYDGDCEDCSSATFMDNEEDGFALNRSFLSAYKCDYTLEKSRDGVEDAFNIEMLFQDERDRHDDPDSPTVKNFNVTQKLDYPFH